MGTAAMKFKRCLLLRTKAMIKLDGLLKSRDITLPANVHIVKAMTYPVVMYGCENAKVHIVKAMAFPVVMYERES